MKHGKLIFDKGQYNHYGRNCKIAIKQVKGSTLSQTTNFLLFLLILI